MPGDCREDEVLERAFAAAQARLGDIDILVNNVGQSARGRAGEFVESDPATWSFVLDVSLVTSMRFARRAAPAMRERGWGRIINMSSDAALVGDAGLADYAAAKSGLLGFTRVLARELAPHGVTVNAVCPGAIRTRATEEMAPDVMARVVRGIPMGRMGEPEDVARLVAFLAGEGWALHHRPDPAGRRRTVDAVSHPGWKTTPPSRGRRFGGIRVLPPPPPLVPTQAGIRKEQWVMGVFM